MLVVTQVVGLVQRSWVRTNSRVSQFREARIAFDTMTKNLSQATLNTYWENVFDPLHSDLGGQFKKARNYVRQSELQFVCGPTTEVITSAGGSAQNYPGHAVFFQAPLGVTRLVAAKDQEANTENMVNLLCGRGYFVEWGDDQPYRPPFLNQLTSVPVRFRLRLMEYSPTAEMNRIYDQNLRPLVDSQSGVNNGKRWFNEGVAAVLSSTVQDNETSITRAFTRPIAENILALIISPQIESTNTTSSPPYVIAPDYFFDSTLTGSTALGGSQGTQHLLPPLLRVTMVAIDSRGGETLSSNSELRDQILQTVSSLFTQASKFEADLEGTPDEAGALETELLNSKINFRVFTTTIAMKQARWSL